MRKLLLLVCLAGCASSPPNPAPTVTVGSPSTPSSAASTPPPPETSGSPSPSGTPTSIEVKTISVEEAIRLTAQSTNYGMTNQARAEMLLNHLFAAGRRRLWVVWDAYHLGQGKYEVRYTIEPLGQNGRPPAATPTPTPGASRNPFDRPIPPPTTTGVQLCWLYDATNSTCVAKDESTRTLLGLKPSLDGASLEQVLPAGWRAAPPPPAAPVGEGEAPTMTVDPEVTETVEADPEVSPTPGQSIQFTGFVGAGQERRAVLTYSGESRSYQKGDRFGGYRVVSIEADELVLEKAGQTFRLQPGMSFSPE